MTTAAARAARHQPRGTGSQRPSLRLVATRPLVAGRLPFAVLIGGILALGLVALLLLHTIAAQDAFRLQTLQHQQAALSDTEQQLALVQQRREAPGALAARAQALGMVATSSVTFVTLHRHGHKIGAVRATAVPPAPVVVPSASPTPKPGASAKPDHSTSGTTPKPGASTDATKPAGPVHQHRAQHRSGR